jgi:dihydrofolate reductase
MRKIIASTYVTLDGFIDDPQLWTFQYSNDEIQTYAMDLVFGSDALLLPRVTYEGMAQAWPNMSGNPFADRVNSIPKYVVSSTLDKAEDWNNSTIIHGDDLFTEVTRLKQQPGENILMWGCGRLTDTLREHGLLDEYHLWIYPVVRGEGQRLFPEGSEATLELAETTTFSTGVVILTYRPVCAPGHTMTAG